MLVDLLSELAAVIETLVTVDKVAVTAGRPAQSDSCSAVYVWANSIDDFDVSTQSRGDITSCWVRRGYVMSYRIDVCRSLPGDGSEQTEAQQLVEATTIYDHADALWCGFASRIVAGTLFSGTDCEDIKLGPLVFEPPQGDRVSATGGIRITYPCGS